MMRRQCWHFLFSPRHESRFVCTYLVAMLFFKPNRQFRNDSAERDVVFILILLNFTSAESELC